MIRNATHKLQTPYIVRDSVYTHASTSEVERIIEEVKLVQDGLSPLPPRALTPQLSLRTDQMMDKRRERVLL